jgi:hypothetical protein
MESDKATNWSCVSQAQAQAPAQALSLALALVSYLPTSIPHQVRV